MNGRLVACVLVVAGCGAAALQPEAMGGRRAELEALRGEIAHLERELDSLSEQRREVGLELDRVRIELELQDARWREAERERFLAEQALVATTAEVERLRQKVDRSRQELRARLGTLYRLGRNGDLRLLLSIASRDDLLPGARSLRFLARRDAERLTRLAEAEADLAAELDALEARRVEVERWERVEAERRERLRELERAVGGRLEGVDRDRRVAADRRTGLAERAAKLADLLDYLVGLPPGDLGEVRSMLEYEGELDWPVEGEVVQGFGPVLDPRYRTSVPHDGVSIEVDRRRRIAAIYPGEVLFAAALDGYGRTVVLRHPGRVFSLYAGLDELRVERGGVVSLGSSVGASAGRMYFEIRVENRPVDPTSWFR